MRKPVGLSSVPAAIATWSPPSHPEQARAANRAETSARLRRGLVPFQAIAAFQLEIGKGSFGVSSEMPVRPPALAAMAVDDVAQGSGHGILDAAAQAAAAVSLAHGLGPIRRGILSITAKQYCGSPLWVISGHRPAPDRSNTRALSLPGRGPTLRALTKLPRGAVTVTSFLRGDDDARCYQKCYPRHETCVIVETISQSQSVDLETKTMVPRGGLRKVS